MAGEPGRQLSPEEDPEYEEGEQDAEGEEDIPMEVFAHTPADHETLEGPEDSEVDAEGEEVDDDLEAEPVGAVKIPHGEMQGDSSEEEGGDDESSDNSDSDAAPGSSSSSEESDADEEWRAESDAAEDGADTAMADSNRCM
jgi:histone acetyltransferase SAS3